MAKFTIDQAGPDQVTVSTGGQAETFSADDLLGLIKALGAARQEVVQGKPIPPLDGVSVDVVYNTRWYVQPEPMTEASVLVFQHPQFGPVGFAVPFDQV